MTAPQYSIVPLPDNVPFEMAARWGYLGTGYQALQRADVRVGTTVLINGISGTLGLGVALFALALGASKVLGTGREHALLQKVKSIAPDRIEVHALDEEVSVGEWAHAVTSGRGVDVVIDTLGPGAPQSSMLAALEALGRGGRHVNIGAVAGDIPVNLHKNMDNNQDMLGSLVHARPRPGNGRSRGHRRCPVGCFRARVLQARRCEHGFNRSEEPPRRLQQLCDLPLSTSAHGSQL